MDEFEIVYEMQCCRKAVHHPHDHLYGGRRQPRTIVWAAVVDLINDPKVSKITIAKYPVTPTPAPTPTI